MSFSIFLTGTFLASSTALAGLLAKRPGSELRQPLKGVAIITSLLGIGFLAGWLL